MMTPLLLDTCAAIWLAEGETVSGQATQALDSAAKNGVPVYVSPMTAWEIGLLVARRRIAITMVPEAWFTKLLAVPGLRLAELSPAILIQSSFLPGSPPRDPVDRIIAATARENGYRIVTRDKLLLDYAGEGHVKALPC